MPHATAVVDDADQISKRTTDPARTLFKEWFA